MTRSSSWIRTAVAFVALAAAGGNAWAQATRIGLIDTRRLITQSTQGKAIIAKLDALADQKGEQLKPKQEEIRALQKKISDGQVSLSDDKLADLKRQLDEKVTGARRLQEDLQKEMEEAQGAAFADFEKTLAPIIEQYGKEQGYTMILNVSFFNQPNLPSGIVWASDQSDITDALIQKLDAQTPAKP